MDERRQYKRFPIKTIVMYIIQDYLQYPEGQLNEIGTPLSADLSEGGMQIITEQSLTLHTYLKISMSIVNSKSIIQVIGQVVWSKKDPDDNKYYIGIKFIKFLEDGKQLLQKQLEEDK